MEEFTVGSAELRALVDGIAALGIDPAALQRGIDLSPSVLGDPEARVPESTLLGLWLAAEAQWERRGEELLGLHAGSKVPPGAFEVLDYLAATGPTIGAGFRRLADFARIANTGLTYAIDDAGDPVVVSMRHPYAFEILPPSFVEYLWVLIVARFREHLDPRFRPALRLRHAPQGSLATYRQILGDVTFNADRMELRVPRAQWDAPNPRRDTGLSQVLERHARDLLAKLPNTHDPLASCRAALLEGLRAGDASVETTAARTHMSVRTLQRLLADRGTSYKALLDEMRGALARTLLASTDRTLLEIAYLLGYSDASAFNRAFRRWTSTTPLEYRTSARAAADALAVRLRHAQVLE
jgi:AraC-like DNA-binding protein